MGRVRSLPRVVVRRNGSPMTVSGGIVKGCTRAGYIRVTLRRKQQFVHRLVLAAFVGPLPDGHEVCHGNGSRSDNALANLRYGTRSDNVRDAIKHGTHFSPWQRGQIGRGRKLNEQLVREIRASDERATHIARRIGVARSLIQRVRNRESWRHVE